MVEPATVESLAELESVIGVKDSSANIVYFNKLRYIFRDRPDFSILIGPEEALGEVVLMGAHGGICGGANLFPQLFVDTWQAAVNVDVARVRELQSEIMRISSLLYGVGRHVSSFIKGVKCSLDLMGICSDVMSQPFNRFREEERALIRERLISLGVKVSAAG